MRINKKRFDDFNMKVNSFTYQPLTSDIAQFQPEGSIYPIIGKTTLKPKDMNFVAEFRSELDISNFMAEVLNHKENLIDIGNGFLYHSFFNGTTTPVNEYWQGWYRITIPFKVIQTGKERVISLGGNSNIVMIAGNWRAECIYEIIPEKDMDSITINGTTIRKLFNGRKVIVDGVKKKIYSTTEPNKYSDCVLKNNAFPIISPGRQEVSVSDTNAKVKLRYSPVYV